MKICEILRQPQGCFLESSQGKKLVSAWRWRAANPNPDGMEWFSLLQQPDLTQITAARLSLREAVAVSECRTGSFPSCKIFCGCVFNKEWMC